MDAAVDGGDGRDAGRGDAGRADAGADAPPPADAGCAPAQPWQAALDDDLSDECGACGGRGAPIGGGEGYPRVVPRSEATVVVSTLDALLDAFASAECGDVVYVDDAATIDVSAHGAYPIAIPAGITLASGRGVGGSPGALIQSAAFGVMNTFQAGEGMRITGLRFGGPQDDVGTPAGTGMPPLTGGILARALEAFEIDNCELYGWSYWAVQVSAGFGHVHHNYIHHNRRSGFGYGVLANGGANTLIESNIFDVNRHSIATNDHVLNRYTARFNLVTIGNGHAFDAHGRVVAADAPPVAGDAFDIHHNTFLLTHDDAVLMAGVPATGASIHHNSFAHVFGQRAVAIADNVSISSNCWAGQTRCP